MFRFRNRGRYHYASRDRWIYVPYSTPVWNRGRERARAYKSRSRPAYSWRIVAHSEAILGPAVRITSRIGPEKSLIGNWLSHNGMVRRRSLEVVECGDRGYEEASLCAIWRR